MADIQAYAIHQIKNGNQNVPASTEARPSIFPIDKESFSRLEKLNAVRHPTKEEIALFKAQQEAIGNGEPEDAEAAEPVKTEDTKPPSSGAAGDPKGKPKGAAEKDDLGV